MRATSGPSVCDHSLQAKTPRSSRATASAKARAAQGAGKTGPLSSRGIEATAARAPPPSGALKIGLPEVEENFVAGARLRPPDFFGVEGDRIEPARVFAAPGGARIGEDVGAVDGGDTTGAAAHVARQARVAVGAHDAGADAVADVEQSRRGGRAFGGTALGERARDLVRGRPARQRDRRGGAAAGFQLFGGDETLLDEQALHALQPDLVIARGEVVGGRDALARSGATCRGSTRRCRPWQALSAKTRRSQAAWKSGSSCSGATGPKPCAPPRSWGPFIASTSREAEAGRRGYRGPREALPAEISAAASCGSR